MCVCAYRCSTGVSVRVCTVCVSFGPAVGELGVGVELVSCGLAASRRVRACRAGAGGAAWTRCSTWAGSWVRAQRDLSIKHPVYAL